MRIFYRLEEKESDLIYLIDQALTSEKNIEATREHLKRLEEIREKDSQGKFKLK